MRGLPPGPYPGSMRPEDLLALTRFLDEPGLRAPDPETFFSAEEHAGLTAAGLLPGGWLSFEHDAAVAELRELAAATDLARAAVGFAASFEPANRTDLAARAVLPAAVFGRALPEHAWKPWTVGPDGSEYGPCAVCGFTDDPVDPGVQRGYAAWEGHGGDGTDPVEALLALRSAEAVLAATDLTAGSAALDRILATIQAAPSGKQVSWAIRALLDAGLFAAEFVPQAAAESALSQLAMLGVLHSPQSAGLLREWSDYSERSHVGGSQNRLVGPVIWWLGQHGLDDGVARELFGDLSLPALADPAESSG